jgi:hypothetical protein
MGQAPRGDALGKRFDQIDMPFADHRMNGLDDQIIADDMAYIVAAAMLGWIDRHFDMESHTLLLALFFLERADEAVDDKSANRDPVENALLAEPVGFACRC